MGIKRTYLNEVLINKTNKKANFQLKLGIGMLIFLGLGIIGADESDLDAMYISFIISLVIPWSYLVWCGWKNKSELKKAKKYDKIFCNDQNGIITAYEMEQALGLKYFDIFVELERLFRCGFFVNCVLQQGRNPSVIIYNAQVNDDKSIGFMQVICPKCGGSTRIRANSRGNCEYCGSEISTIKAKKPNK